MANGLTDYRKLWGVKNPYSLCLSFLLISNKLIIVCGVIASFLIGWIILVLYRAGRDIKKKNRLLQEQNLEIQTQNNEIRSQHEKISLQAEELRVEGEFLALQNEKLSELNHEKDALMSIVAHDLRSPLNQSKGLAKILRTTPLSKEQKDLMELIIKVNDEGLLLIKDMLQVNSITHQAVESESVNLHDLIHERVLPALQDQANRKKISFFPSVDKALTIFSDPLSLRRILENLLSNAIKFSMPDTHIYVRVMSSDDSVYISVQDEGPGISEEDQKKMFRKFQRLSARPTSGESSTGLGLAIVKGLVEKLHGEITVKSKIDVGSEFSIRFNKVSLMKSTQSIPVNHKSVF